MAGRENRARNGIRNHRRYPRRSAGALVASYLFPKLGIHLGTGLLSEIIYSAIGAVVLLLIVRLVRTGGRF
jgi:hypothetical protein